MMTTNTKTTDAALALALTTYRWYEVLTTAADCNDRVVAPDAWRGLAARLETLNPDRARDCIMRAMTADMHAWSRCTLQAAQEGCASVDPHGAGLALGRAVRAAGRSLEEAWVACKGTRLHEEWPAVWNALVDGWYDAAD